jgi:hypothetical protein
MESDKHETLAFLATKFGWGIHVEAKIIWR